MKTANATAAAAALLLGSVSADLESQPSDVPSDADQAWGTWTSSTTTTPADPSTWSEWDPAASTSSTTSTNTQTWSDWASTTSSTPVTKTSTSSDPSWSQWTSSSVSSASVSSQSTWSAWDPIETVTSTSTQWATVTILPVNPVNAAQSWSAWSSAKTTKTDTTVVSNTVTKTATGVKDTTSSSATWGPWSSIATPVAVVDPLCKLEISISYGLPVWYPTPVIATSVNSTAWGNWDGASSTPAASTSTGPASAWSQWTPATSSTPAVKTSTDPAGSWSAWQSASSATPVSKITDSASSWGAWGSISQTQGGAFYTASAGSNGGSYGSGSNSNSGSNSGSWSKGSTGISANGNKFGMTYSPYTASGGCKDQGTVSADIAQLAAKGFTSVRVYSTDCSTLEFVGNAAKQNGVKVILGVFISDTGISGAQPQVDAIAQWAQWDLVELIVVGNEAVFGGQCSASDLAGFIGSAKATFKAAGFTGAISTTDELSIWQSQGSVWCDVVDVVSANLYAFFNADTAAEDAGDFIQRQIQDLSTVCPGKEVYVMESGWPSAGECNGKACPSPDNQATAIKGIQQTSGAKVVFFSFEDEQWKQPGQFNVEQHWGCGSLFD